jgi:hypothetical protein
MSRSAKRKRGKSFDDMSTAPSPYKSPISFYFMMGGIGVGLVLFVVLMFLA